MPPPSPPQLGLIEEVTRYYNATNYTVTETYLFTNQLDKHSFVREIFSHQTFRAVIVLVELMIFFQLLPAQKIVDVIPVG